MIASPEWLNPTRACGLVAYATAVVCCALAWVKSRGKKVSKVAMVSTIIEGFLLLDIAFSWRLHLHDLFGNFAARHNEYASRRLPQVMVLLVLAAILTSGLVLVWRRTSGRPGARLAISGVLISIALWWTEVISLHQVDHIMYYRLGGFVGALGDLMAICVLWFLAALTASIGNLISALAGKPNS